VLSWHQDLAEFVADRAKCRRIGVPTPQSERTSEDDSRHDRVLAALRIAVDRGLPLFVDDRLCQAAVLNRRRQDTSAAFGIDAFLVALLDERKISVAAAANHFKQLMAWRYRFLLPPACVLTHLAREYSANPPGAPLIDITHYVHDCMRDPGLFSGPEPTKPPLPLAFHFWYNWMGTIGEFLLELWLDPKVDEDTALAITRWASSECLPIPPHNLHPFARHNAAAGSAQVLLGAMLMHSIQAENEDAANRALLAAKESLGVSDLDYLRLIGDMCNVSFQSEP